MFMGLLKSAIAMACHLELLTGFVHVPSNNGDLWGMVLGSVARAVTVFVLTSFVFAKTYTELDHDNGKM